MIPTPPIHIIGAGLAGSEAAWQVASRGVPVVLHEMRPQRSTEAHRTDGFAELVCSNSLRADDAEVSAIGLLHEELRRCGSLILATADAHRVPAGGALAVDREPFSATVTAALTAHPLVTVVREEVAGLPPEDWEQVIIATGPLTSPALGEGLRTLTGTEALAFFDAIAPIVHADSVDLSVAWFQSRYDRSNFESTGGGGAGGGEAVDGGAVDGGTGGETAGGGVADAGHADAGSAAPTRAAPGGGDGRDYLNCPLDRPQYEAFVAALLAAETVAFHDWERNTPYFEGCLPIEVMAARGVNTLRFGPMKPVGLTDPRTGRWPYAVVQLRQDNALATLYNLVGFQTKLRHGDQVRILRMIPGLERAEFARLGGLHRNTFLNSPVLLTPDLCLRAQPRLRFAGQITGCEGYAESAAIGLLAGRFAVAAGQDRPACPPPIDTALGALLGHITGGARAETFQPMNVNFGLFPPVESSGRGKERGRARKKALVARARQSLTGWLGMTDTLPGAR